MIMLNECVEWKSVWEEMPATEQILPVYMEEKVIYAHFDPKDGTWLYVFPVNTEDCQGSCCYVFEVYPSHWLNISGAEVIDQR